VGLSLTKNSKILAVEPITYSEKGVYGTVRLTDDIGSVALLT
jgi:hypothetical protein